MSNRTARSDAERQRERRRRLRCGLAQWVVEVDAGVIDRLIEHGFLRECELKSQEMVGHALSRAIVLALRRKSVTS
jgi:hypothetical protein